MSGSGSVIVGKFSDNAKAKSVANTLGSGDWAWRVILTRNVTRDGYEESLSKALE